MCLCICVFVCMCVCVCSCVCICGENGRMMALGAYSHTRLVTCSVCMVEKLEQAPVE